MNRKGCFADQSTTDQTVCSANNNTCLTCSTSNCNTNNVRPDERCIVCKSDINPQCAQKPHELSPERCLLPSDGQCYAKISGMNLLITIRQFNAVIDMVSLFVDGYQ